MIILGSMKGAGFAIFKSINSSLEDLVAFINSKSRGRIADPKETAKILQAAARNSYRLDRCLYEPLTISIASSFNCISSFEKELKAIDKAILQTVQGLNPTLCTAQDGDFAKDAVNSAFSAYFGVQNKRV